MRECRKERLRDGVCPQALTLSLSFSLQNEGTRLQKDLRTYLASVKGKRQTWPGWAGLHGTQERAFPGRGLPRVEPTGKELGRAAGCMGDGQGLLWRTIYVLGFWEPPVLGPHGPACSMALLPYSYA